ncbi:MULTISPECIES: carbohydrate ABC transporter permease [unclassified Butyrivibrio]|uniref:carbohydrate ABC transporter permease n=1 Tax=unclassified Butyrivibrio TaxID=2639466 RepID=UPI0003FA0503|nr:MULTISPECIES: sugar ABC transporter permease [unclassified Butyrivibrio]
MENKLKVLDKVKDKGEKLNRMLRRNAAGQTAMPKKRTNLKEHLQKKSTRKKIRETVVSWLFLSPSLAGVLTFFVLPFLVVVFYAVVNNPIQKEFVGFDNFVRVFNNNAFKQAASNTLMFSAVAVPLAVALSLFLAVVMESGIPFKSQFRSFFLSPMMVPIASIVLIWQVLFDYNGLINQVYLAFGGPSKIDWLKSDKAQIVVVILFLWKNLGYNMILFMAALSSVPKDLIEVARLESATERQIFWSIKMRYLSSTILFVTIMSLINSFKVFREVYLLTGDYPYQTLYMMQHFMNNTFASVDYQKLSASAIMMAIVVVILMFIMFITEDRYGRDIEG